MKLYIGTLQPDRSYLPILYPHLGKIDKPQRPFFNFADSFQEKLFELTDDPSEADYLFIPHDFFAVSSRTEYIKHFTDLAERTGKQILIIDQSDFDSDIHIPHSIIFRASRYKDQLKPNEIMMPPIIEDLGKNGITTRAKGNMPIVGFCGWAGFKTLKEKVKYAFKILSNMSVHKPGIYFRRSALRAASASSRIKTNFIVRYAYSGHNETIELSPEEARTQYIENIVHTDFTLAPKGDGNYSTRFFEVLSLGRIPVLIDTDCILPLEDEIDYNDFIVRISYKDMARLGDIISERFNGYTDESYKDAQLKARNIFETKLNAPAFFKNVFKDASFLSTYK